MVITHSIQSSYHLSNIVNRSLFAACTPISCGVRNDPDSTTSRSSSTETSNHGCSAGKRKHGREVAQEEVALEGAFKSAEVALVRPWLSVICFQCFPQNSWKSRLQSLAHAGRCTCQTEATQSSAIHSCRLSQTYGLRNPLTDSIRSMHKPL